MIVKKWAVLLGCPLLMLCLVACGGKAFYASADTLESGLHGLRIAIDPGHGGIDKGAVGTDTGITEAELNLEISQLLAKRLMLDGSDVLLTRKSADVDYTGDGNTQKRRDMNSRARLVQAQDPQVLVSIHLNKYPSRSVSGAQVFYQKGSEGGEMLAVSIQQALNDGLDARNRLAKAGDYFMLKVHECPSVIVECGFLSNHNEEKKLLDASYREKLAECIYQGICAYLGME